MGDHAALHVARDKTELGGHAGAERLLAAERQDRNRELALGQEGLVVEAVLRERDELLEGVMNRMRPRVEVRIVPASRLVDGAGIAGQFIPEAIEVDALAARNQTLLVGPMEIEMPELRIAELLRPMADTGQRRVDCDLF